MHQPLNLLRTWGGAGQQSPRRAKLL